MRLATFALFPYGAEFRPSGLARSKLGAWPTRWKAEYIEMTSRIIGMG